jgi:hypothetical protein
MTGHVFHPGHHELHGITVVLETHGTHTYVGRFDSEDARGVHLLDVAVHDAAAGGLSKEEYIRRSARFGVRPEQKHLLVPAEQVAKIRRLGDVEAA